MSTIASKLGPIPAPLHLRLALNAGEPRLEHGPRAAAAALPPRAGYPGYRLNWRKAPGRPDIAYPGRKVAIFVHGCFWHRCPSCNPPYPKAQSEFWKRKFAAQQERDARKLQPNWKPPAGTVITVWECQVREDLGRRHLRSRHCPLRQVGARWPDRAGRNRMTCPRESPFEPITNVSGGSRPTITIGTVSRFIMGSR